MFTVGSHRSVRPQLSDSGKLCFAVATSALVLAGLLAAANAWLDGLPNALGLFLVATLYTSMGLMELKGARHAVPARKPATAATRPKAGLQLACASENA